MEPSKKTGQKAAIDKVFVKNLVLPCKVGFFEEERKEKQNVIIDIEIFCDLSKAGATDDLDKTISYSEVQEKVTDIVVNGEFKLLESLAETIAALILKSPAADTVTVTIKKEKYGKKPIMGIEITREQNG
jgi:FolB domain-containing protein